MRYIGKHTLREVVGGIWWCVQFKQIRYWISLCFFSFDCVHVCLQVYEGAHECACLWRPGDNLRYCSSGAIYPVFLWDRASHWSGIYQVGWLGRLASKQTCFPLSSNRTIISMSYSTPLFYMGSGDGTWVFMLARKGPHWPIHLPGPTFIS